MSRITFVLLVVVGVLLGTDIAQGQQQQCPQNQEWNSCGSACPPTCTDPSPNRACTFNCVIGCQCKEGYLLDSWGHCLAPHECLR